MFSDAHKAASPYQGIHQHAADILESISDAFWALDREWRFTYLNSAAERMLGRPAGALLGTDSRPELAALLGERIGREQRRAMDQNAPVRFEEYSGPLGRWYEIRAFPSPSGLSVYVQDITERRHSEEERAYLLRSEQAARAEAEAANRRKDQFLAILSHELRTPLTPVLARLLLLKRDPQLPAEVRSSVEMIRRNVELEASLIDDLLDITRIARGKLQLNLEPVDAHERIHDALDIYQPTISAQRQHVNLELSADNSRVRADPARLQQIFWNLISNAVKYTPEGGTITIRTYNGESDEATKARSDEGKDAPADSSPSSLRRSVASSLVIEISDTGIGIEPPMMERLFKSFEQGEQSLTRRYGGLGLGLAICKALVELMGGKISAASAGRNRGATFTVQLPTLQAAERAVPPRPARILLVEDNDDTRRIVSRLLQHAGHDVRTAASLHEAQDLALSNNFDILISDLGLPDGSGWELMRELSRQRSIKGIALSGFGTEQDIQKSREAGFTTHLTKPIDLRRLEEAIEEARV